MHQLKMHESGLEGQFFSSWVSFLASPYILQASVPFCGTSCHLSSAALGKGSVTTIKKVHMSTGTLFLREETQRAGLK